MSLTEYCSTISRRGIPKWKQISTLSNRVGCLFRYVWRMLHIVIADRETKTWIKQWGNMTTDSSFIKFLINDTLILEKHRLYDQNTGRGHIVCFCVLDKGSDLSNHQPSFYCLRNLRICSICGLLVDYRMTVIRMRRKLGEQTYIHFH